MEIEFTSLAQAHAVYDVVEHRVLTVSPDATLPESEVAEVMELVGFMLRLSPMIKNDTEESLMPAGALHNYRELRIAKALTSVKAAENARRLFDNLPADHAAKTSQNDETTTAFLEDTIRTAMEYGYPVEAVAVAASLTVEQVHEIVDSSADS